MRVSKRDFLKSLGFSAAAGAAFGGSKPLPKEPGVIEAPFTPEPPPLPACRDFEIVDEILYDRVVFAAGETFPGFVRLFTTPEGSVCPYDGQVKLRSRTNMVACQLQAPSSFWVQRIHIATNPDISARDLKATRAFSWNFWIGQKRYASGPFVTDLERRTLADLLKRKTPALRQSLEFPHSKGLYIPAQCTFYADIMLFDHARRLDRSPYWLNDPPRVGLDPEGAGVEFAITLEGIRWWPLQ